MEWLNTILQGVLLGGLYAMFAAGLSLIFGVMRLVNIAHGDLIVLAAYVALVTVQALGVNPLVSLVVVVPVMAAIGYALQRGLLNRTLGDDLLPPLLVTFGLSVIIQNGLLEMFTADSVKLNAGAGRGRQHPGRRRARGRRAAADPVRARGRGHRRPAMAVLPHRARPRLPRHLRRPVGGAAHGAEQCARLRARHGALARHRRGRRRAAGGARQLRSGDRAGAAHLRLRGGDHRRARHPCGARSPAASSSAWRRPSARRSIPAGTCSPVISRFCLCWRSSPRGLFPKVQG